MIHGIHSYFHERAAFRRRLGGTILGVAAVMLSALFGWGRLHETPGFESRLRDLKILHWGYEGPEQFVRRIELKTESRVTSRNEGLEAQYVPRSTRGGQ